MRKTIIIMAMTATLASCQDKYPDLENGVYAEFVTNQGTFVAKLYHDQTPLTVANFVDLANGKNAMVDSAHQGKPYYNGLIFHRVIKDFMIQGGDPDGTGSGGPGYQFPDEIVDEPKHDRKGILSMANAGPGTNGSQFFVTLAPTPHLDGKHTVFGEVVKGMEVVEAIGNTTTGTADKPESDIVMEEVNIIDKSDNELDSFEVQMEEIEAERKKAEARLSGLNAETLEELKALEAEAEELDSGLKMLFTEKGDGNTPNEGDTVLVNYEGYLLADGSLFDSNLKEVAEKHEKYDAQRDAQGGYTPMPAPYSPDAQFIAGFREGLLSMNIGDKAVLFIPSHLGYGPQGAGELIPPNADLVFKLEIVGIAE